MKKDTKTWSMVRMNMVMANPRIHIICGVCGCNNMFKFKIHQDGMDVEGEQFPAVYISCGNCATLTSLAELMKEEDPPYAHLLGLKSKTSQKTK